MRKLEFERIVDKTLWGLEAKHGFKKTETEYYRGGVTVRFQNPTTEVILNYEIGSFPWLTIADIKNPETGRSSLDWLLVELGEKKTPSTDEAFSPAKMDEGQLEAELQRKCDQLLSHGADFLAGDFTLLPKLQKRAENFLADCKKFADRQNIKS
jgi:hypothetical protein